MNNDKIHDLIIIGAGLTGLHLAKTLQGLGVTSLLLEKSKGLGGRIATRRISDLGFDHGALFLKSKDTLSESVRFLQDKRGFYLEGGMNQLPKAMASGLEILRDQRLESILNEQNIWNLKTVENLVLKCKNLLITAPLPQALELLEANSLLPPGHQKLRSVHYSKALIYLAVLKDLPETLTIPEIESDKIFLMRNRKLHPQGVVMHLSPELSESLFVQPDATILSTMREEFDRSTLGKYSVLIDELKKWKFSKPLTTLPESFIELTPGIILTGDAFNGALQSANNLVQVLRS